MLFLKQGLCVSLINCGLAVFCGTVSGSGFYLQFYMLLSFKAAVPNLFGTRNWFHGRQFFSINQGMGGGWFREDSSTLH